MNSDDATLRADSLVLYKIHPARVLAVGEKIEIALDKGPPKRVRPKDIVLLHPGPLHGFAELESPPEGEREAAWELLEDSQTTLVELAELIHDAFTPATAWATWQLVRDGLYFSGTPEVIRAHGRAAVEAEIARRQAKAAAERDWEEFLGRMAAGTPAPVDAERLAEVERLAFGQSAHSRILQALGQAETPERAHRALIQVGHWPAHYNPHPGRYQLPEQSPERTVGPLPEEERLDLTHLPAYAIDDVGNQDPDDALSLDGQRLWVHVADVAALVAPDSALDREARARGSNQYLPERTVAMLPEEITARLGLGLSEVSPALSFGFQCAATGEPEDLLIRPSWIRAERLSYEAVETRLQEPPFAALEALTRRFRERRLANGATEIDLPEVSVRVQQGEVHIHPLPRLRSRALVMEAMLLAGEAVARFCQEQAIPIAYATQPPPDRFEPPADLAAMYACRRRFKPSRLIGEPAPHAGLGLPLYTRVTSPLRRYSDLLVHQQLRAWLRQVPVLAADAVTARIGEAETAAMAVRRAERLSNQHWKLVFLATHPEWRGEAVVVDKEERKSVLLIPELALETRLHLRTDPPLNTRVRVMPREIDLPELSVRFGVKG